MFYYSNCLNLGSNLCATSILPKKTMCSMWFKLKLYSQLCLLCFYIKTMCSMCFK